MTLPGDRRLARSHLERAYELDPTLRPRTEPNSGALDAATEESIIARAIRAVRAAAAPRHATQRTLSMFDSNRLFQRAPGDPAYRERRSRAHALDAEPEGAREHVQKALNHVTAVQSGSSTFDPERLRGYLDRALAALSEEGADEFEEREDGRLDEDQVTDPVGHGGPPTIRRGHEGEGADGEEEYGPRLGDRRRGRDAEELGETPPVSAVGLSTRDRRRRARDAMGETPARSAVSTKGLRRRVDHRDDFNDRAQAAPQSGADSRHGHDGSLYDADTLFQRSGTR
jgi:hypothetical protein